MQINFETLKLCKNNTFAKDRLTSWNLFRKDHKQNDIKKPTIWNNSEIKINNKALILKKMHDYRIVYLEHIFLDLVNSIF